MSDQLPSWEETEEAKGNLPAWEDTEEAKSKPATTSEAKTPGAKILQGILDKYKAVKEYYTGDRPVTKQPSIEEVRARGQEADTALSQAIGRGISLGLLPEQEGSKEVADKYPALSTATEIAAGGGVGKGLKTAGSAVVGGLQAAGTSEASGLEYAGDILEGAGVGAATGALGVYGGKAVGKAKDILERIKKSESVRALGAKAGQLGRKFKTVEQKTQLLGEGADRGVVTAGASAETMAERVKDIGGKAGSEFESIEKQVMKAADEGLLGVQPTQTVEALMMDPVGNTGVSMAKRYGEGETAAEFQKALTQISESLDSPNQLRQLKKEFAAKGMTSTGQPVATEKGDMYRVLAAKMDAMYVDQIGELAQKTGNADLLARYAKAKRDYAFAKEAEKSLASKMGRETAGGEFSPFETAGIAAGIAGGRPVQALFAAVGRKSFRDYGASTMASAANRVQQALESGTITPEQAKALLAATRAAGVKGVSTEEE